MEFSLFFHEICMVSRSYQVFAADIESLITCAVVTLESRLKVSILENFLRFSTFFKLSVLTKAFDL